MNKREEINHRLNSLNINLNWIAAKLEIKSQTLSYLLESDDSFDDELYNSISEAIESYQYELDFSKSHHPIELDLFDEEKLKDGIGERIRIFAKRKLFIKEFEPIFNKRYDHIIATSKTEETIERVSFSYKTQLEHLDFKSVLKQSLEKDRVLQYSSAGIHKDDLLFQINEHPIKKIGSQGQQKSFLIALKLAQFDFITNKSHIKPIMLLDDIFDKLDDQRVGQLLQLVNDDSFGQLFITDTHDVRTEALIKETGQSYKMFGL